MNFPLEKDDWKKFERNIAITSLNVWYPEKEKMCPAYVLQHNTNREKQVIFLRFQMERDDIVFQKKIISIIKKNL